MTFMRAPESREVERFALFSDDRKYRYLLRRRFVGRTTPLRLCVWMNPSDADEKKDDASIRVGMSFARKWGDGGIIVVNVMDLVLTDSKKLPKNRDEAVGPMHRIYAEAAFYGGYGAVQKEVMCGWGDAGAGPLVAPLLQCMRYYGLVPCALALTKAGNPCHPLRKSLDLVLKPFVIEERPSGPLEMEA